MPGPGIDFIFEAVKVSWAVYDLYKEQFEEESPEAIRAMMETRGTFERIRSYIPFSVAEARKKAARDTIKERQSGLDVSEKIC